MRYEYCHPFAPWLTAEAISIIDHLLRPTDIGLECGAGRSTTWLARRTAFLTSIEHCAEWAERVEQSLQQQDLNTKVRLCLREDGATNSPDSTYVQTLDSIEPGSLDYCLIDGVSRDLCALRAVAKMKPGGLLIIDDVDRYVPRIEPTRSPASRSLADGYSSEAWREFHQSVSTWRCIWTTNGITDTAIWIRADQPPALGAAT